LTTAKLLSELNAKNPLSARENGSRQRALILAEPGPNNNAREGLFFSKRCLVFEGRMTNAECRKYDEIRSSKREAPTLTAARKRR
jgi:hypothetical protein